MRKSDLLGFNPFGSSSASNRLLSYRPEPKSVFQDRLITRPITIDIHIGTVTGVPSTTKHRREVTRVREVRQAGAISERIASDIGDTGGRSYAGQAAAVSERRVPDVLETGPSVAVKWSGGQGIAVIKRGALDTEDVVAVAVSRN